MRDDGSQRRRRGQPRSAWPVGRVLFWIACQLVVAATVAGLGIWLLLNSSRTAG